MATRPILLYSNSAPTKGFDNNLHVPVDPTCKIALENALSRFASSARVIPITDDTMLKRELGTQNPCTLVVPGGHAYGLNSSLGAQTEEIRSLIDSNRLNYFGICAGAIFSGQSLAKLTPYFAPPAFKPWEEGVSGYQKNERRTVRIVREEGDFYSLWNKGPYFQTFPELIKPGHQVEVLAEYTINTKAYFKTPTAIAAFFYRQKPTTGSIVSIGFHPEFCSDQVGEICNKQWIEDFTIDSQTNQRRTDTFFEDALKKVQILS